MDQSAGDEGPAPALHSKLLGLELVRVTCAVAVLVWHYHHFAMIGDGAAMLRPHAPLAGLLSPFYRFGLFGVQIFWCISGFIFYWKYADAVAARAVAPWRFFWLRFSRLYPLHFVTLLIVAALQPAYVALAGKPFVFQDISAGSFLLQLGLADQWGGPRAMSFNGPIWSVSSEVFVYVGFFLLLRTFGKSRRLIAAAIAASLWSIWSGATSPALICGGYFFAGGAAAQCLASSWVRGHRGLALWSAIGLIAVAVAAAMFVGFDDIERRLPTLLLFVAPPLLFLAAQEWRALERWQTPIQAAGNLTYASYLIHFPLQLALAIVVMTSGIVLPLANPLFLIAYIGLTMALARVVFVRFERPVQDAIRQAMLSPRPVALTS